MCSRPCSSRPVGQVNGLVVILAGDYAFGSPVRISATARMGGGTLIDIETEAKLSGAIHSKGVMILSAYLANRYARHQPLSVSASLVFEQSYGEVEGDSASLGELCALLSAIGDLMLHKDVRAAAGEGRFAIYAVGHVDQVMALLTGMPAGSPDANGLYPQDSCNGRIQLRLFEWTAARQQFASVGENQG